MQEIKFSFKGAEHGGNITLDTNDTQEDVYTVTSGRKAKLRTLIITNRASAGNIIIGDVSCNATNTKLSLMCPQESTLILEKDELYGIEFLSRIVAMANVSGVWIHVGVEEY